MSDHEEAIDAEGADHLVVGPLSVFEAWAAVMRDVDHVAKDERNTHQNFNFRGIDAVMNVVGPALRTHQVVIVPELLRTEMRDVQVGEKRTNMREAVVEVKYTVFGPAGDWFCGTVSGEALDSGDKATAKAHSVAFRTFLLQALAIPTDEPDPDTVSYERSPGRTARVVDTDSNLFIKETIARLDPNTTASLKVWWKRENIPPLGSLTSEEADRVELWIVDNSPEATPDGE